MKVEQHLNTARHTALQVGIALRPLTCSQASLEEVFDEQALNGRRAHSSSEAKVESFASRSSANDIRSRIVKALGSPAIYVAHDPKQLTPAASAAKLIVSATIADQPRWG